MMTLYHKISANLKNIDLVSQNSDIDTTSHYFEQVSSSFPILTVEINTCFLEVQRCYFEKGLTSDWLMVWMCEAEKRATADSAEVSCDGETWGVIFNPVLTSRKLWSEILSKYLLFMILSQYFETVSAWVWDSQSIYRDTKALFGERTGPNCLHSFIIAPFCQGYMWDESNGVKERNYWTHTLWQHRLWNPPASLVHHVNVWWWCTRSGKILISAVTICSPGLINLPAAALLTQPGL